MSEIELIGIFIRKNLSGNKALISQLSVEQFTLPLTVLSNFSVGQHFRHMIEFYVCMLNQLERGIICYDERERDMRIEKDPGFALLSIESIISNIATIKKDKRLRIRVNFSTAEDLSMIVETSLCRELAYNLEHSIHHQALIKIGLSQFPEIKVDAEFGIAPSTLRNKKLAVNEK